MTQLQSDIDHVYCMISFAMIFAHQSQPFAACSRFEAHSDTQQQILSKQKDQYIYGLSAG